MKKMNIQKRIKKAMVTISMVATMAMTVTTTAFASEADGSKSGRLPAGQEEPAHYHQPGWIAKEPTCTEPGLMQDICPYHPDYVWSEEEIPALGHNMGEWVIIKEATYEEPGLEVRDCSRGDLHEEREIPMLEKHEHKFGDWKETTTPTCDTDGEAERTCDCGDKEVKSIAATGHNYKVTEDVAATCTEDGRHVEVCENCGDEKVTIIPALDHNYKVTEDVAATCTEDGRHVEVCENCGDEKVTIIPALDHNYGEWHIIKAPEIGVEGIEERYCSRCGHKEQRTIPALTDDNTPDDDIVPDDNDEDIVPEDDDEPDVLSEYIPENDDTDDVVNNEPDVLSEYIPQTGDTSNVFIYVVMLLGALLVLVAATRKEEQ